MACSDRQRLSAGALRCAFAMLLTSLFAAGVVQAQTLTVLHTFGGTDGSGPYAGITLDAHGNLYGVTGYGGELNCDLGGRVGCGVAFKLTKENSSWILSLLYEFNNGSLPVYPSQIALGPNGSPYGAQLEGGSLAQGTVYNLQPPFSILASVNSLWSISTLHEFGHGTDGAYPHHIIFDPAGNIFGATGDGGTWNEGTIYELTPSGGGDWTESILYSFRGAADGKLPKEVVRDDAGNLWGVTEQGGNSGCSPFQGCGTIFELTPSGSGWTKTILHSFQQDTEGGYPGPLMRDSSGNLYGLTSQNGPDGYGVFWELSPSNGGWVFNVLHVFNEQIVSLFGPFAPVMDATGALVGVNNDGGVNRCGDENCGDIYKLAPSGGGWTFTDVYDFASNDNGCLPIGPVALDGAGNLYGVTYGCGQNFAGVVWEFTP